MQTTQRQRLARFKRIDQPPRWQLTDRDLNIIESVADCRFMTRHQVQKLLFTPGAASLAKRRLALLYHHGYLQRTPIPLRNSYGAVRTVYSLDRAGADLLASERRWEASGWRVRDADREMTFLDHHLDVIDVRLSFTLACRPRGLALDWTDERELRRRDVAHRVRGREGQTVTVIPDAYLVIASTTGIDGFAIEVDRATVTERRMKARFQAYGQWAKTGAYMKKLPAQSFRVLVAVTDTRRDARRVEHLKGWCEEVGGGSLFWFVDRSGLESDVLADAVWHVAGGSGTRTLPLSGQ